MRSRRPSAAMAARSVAKGDKPRPLYTTGLTRAPPGAPQFFGGAATALRIASSRRSWGGAPPDDGRATGLAAGGLGAGAAEGRRGAAGALAWTGWLLAAGIGAAEGGAVAAVAEGLVAGAPSEPVAAAEGAP